MPEYTSVDELFQKFTDKHWNAMSQAEHLETLQQMENLIAREQNRPPFQVRIFSEETMKKHPGMTGYFDGRTINLTPLYFRRALRAIPGVNSGMGMAALNTLLHEGRHGWQRFIAAGGGVRVDPKLRSLLRMNFLSYCSPDDNQFIYACQPLELDARRFAKERFAAMAKRAIDAGCDDACIRRQLQNNITVEINAAAIVANQLSIAELRDYEDRARQLFLKEFPDENLDGVSMFDEVIQMIRSRQDYINYVDGKPLDFQEQTLDRVAEAGFAPEGVEAPADPMLQGLLARLKPGRVGDGGNDGRIDTGRLGLR